MCPAFSPTFCIEPSTIRHGVCVGVGLASALPVSFPRMQVRVHRLSRTVLFCVFLSPPHLYVKTKYTNTHIDIRIYFYAQEHQKR